MPNYVSNILTIDAPENKYGEIIAQITNEDGVFDFNTIVPMPEALNIDDESLSELAASYLLCCSGSDIIPHESKNKIVEQFTRSGIVGERRKLLLEQGKQYLRNIADYGYTTWYEWRRVKWGTKWNACNPRIRGNQIYFDTAWGAPIPVLIALSRKLPEVRFEYVFADEDAGFNTGWGFFFNGQEEMTYPEGDSNDAWNCYFSTHRDMQDLYELVDGKWQRIEEE